MTRGSISALGLCLALLPACTEVLGFERARLDADADAGSAGSSGSAGSAVDDGARVVATGNDWCTQEPLPACETCMQGCAGALQACLSTDDCRTELKTYAYCLGPQCDHDQERCILDLSPPEIQDCASECADTCTRTSLVSLCDLYCACMAEACASEGLTDCMSTCRDLPGEVTACRYDHCDYAADQTGDKRIEHCQHASNRIPICASHDEVPIGDRSSCLDRQESLWACNVDSECCSDQCLSGGCR